MKLRRRIIAAGSALPSWVALHAWAIVVAWLVLGAVGAGLAVRLPLHTESSWLLPESKPSVVALRRLLARRPSATTISIGIGSPDPEATRRFALDLADALRHRLPRALVADVDDDDGPLREFFWRNRFLFPSVEQLREAREALRRRITDEKARHNPLLVDLEDDPPPATPELDRLRDDFDALRAARERPAGYVAEEGHLRLIVLRCLFGGTEPGEAQALLDDVARIVADLGPLRYHERIDVGFAGEPVHAAYESSRIHRDVAVSAALCLSLVALLLLGTLRSLRIVIALCLSTGVACVITFGLARLWIGHLNTFTAFLGSVVAGNGINFGIILAFRFRDQLRDGVPRELALAAAMGGTAKATAVAAVAAGTAYFSLAVTSFRGFSEFGIIAGTGMVTCWLASYLLLPALLTIAAPLQHGRADRVAASRASARPLIAGTAPSRWTGVTALVVVIVSAGLALFGAVALWRDPFEDDLTRLGSRSLFDGDIHRWLRRLDAAFGRDPSLGFYVGAQRAEDVPLVMRALADLERDVPVRQRLLGRVDALPVVVPGTIVEQTEKIAILGEVRRLMAEIEPNLDPHGEDAQRWRDLMPPPAGALRPVLFADLPERLRGLFTEADGRIGLLLTVRPGDGYQAGSCLSRRRAAALVESMPISAALRRSLDISGSDSIYADMLSSVEHDGPRAAWLSFTVILALIVIAFGPGRHSLAVSASLVIGVAGMLAMLAIMGRQLNFLCFVAVPITIGIGVDYPLNVVSRLRQGGKLREIAGAVTVCSATTIIGYSVLLLADTGAIRAFGLTAVLGELTCLLVALVHAPCILAAAAWLNPRRDGASDRG